MDASAGRRLVMGVSVLIGGGGGLQEPAYLSRSIFESPFYVTSTIVFCAQRVSLLRVCQMK